ncbi:hypothetical protein [Wohlfahrtiimonas chitiniclastica]|uniref:hypothetical protein n=1 Tax=Wohlfahrtiimonas chitiniclastica TaxID=400946 RepID=UPI001BCB00C5|nr:hypothetical protein [Wohlfahrtiimonas chitiniclastica]MBS7833972.1 hypothetical protein [Wohlfahrtiimonas chitiniclastica]MBS7835616.1 hypothetical protein [Wohlfahrtiimonas chitiniclastica]
MIVINRTQVRHILSTNGTLIRPSTLEQYEADGIIPKGKKSGNTYIYSVEELSKALNTSKESIIEKIHAYNNSRK